jgi:hypothetical protein
MVIISISATSTTLADALMEMDGVCAGAFENETIKRQMTIAITKHLGWQNFIVCFMFWYGFMS